MKLKRSLPDENAKSSGYETMQERTANVCNTDAKEVDTRSATERTCTGSTTGDVARMVFRTQAKQPNAIVSFHAVGSLGKIYITR